MIQGVYNLSDASAKGSLLVQLAALEGHHRVEIARYRGTLSDRQRRYYFAAVVQTLVNFRREQGEIEGKDECHAILKENCLPAREVIDRRTGEVIGHLRRSITDLEVGEMAQYIDRCCAWLGQMGLTVPPPEARLVEDVRRHREDAA